MATASQTTAPFLYSPFRFQEHMPADEKNHATISFVPAVVLDSSILPSPSHVFCACLRPLRRHRTEAILDLTGEWLPRKACDRLGP
jgi:hypothetical protein